MLTINADELPRFMACNGSRLMAASLPPSVSDDTSQRDEGTAAHYMAVAVFNGHHTLSELIDRKAPNGVFMTSEMSQHVAAYLEVCADDADKRMEVDTSHDFAPHWVVNGRSDFVSFNRTSGLLRIRDFKYGHRLVEPEQHWTLISHAIGWSKQNPECINNVELQIFQPHSYHPDGPLRTWPITAHRLTDLYGQLSNTLCNPANTVNTSPFCGTCHANATCPAARRAECNAIDASDMVFSDTISNELLSVSLDNLNRASDMIKSRLEAFTELAKHRVVAGQVVENYSAKMGLGNSRFKAGFDGPMLQMLTGKDLTEAKLVTPAEAKRRGVSDDVLKTLTERPTTGVKLERVKADKKAARLFGK